MIKAIVLDFDGVIADSEPLHYRAFLHVAQRFGVRFTYPQYLTHLVGLDDRDGFRAILQNATDPPPTTDDLIDTLCREKFAAFQKLVNQGAALIPGAREFIEHAAKYLPLAIASGATRQDIDLILQPTGLLQHFHPIVTADDVQQSKPHPQTYTLAAQGLAQKHPQLNITPDSCIAIEDTPAGLASAHAAGLKTIALTTTTPPQNLTPTHQTHGTLQNLTVEKILHLFQPPQSSSNL